MCYWFARYCFVYETFQLYFQNELNKAKRKKCGAHTHAHHLSQFASLDIHVGCCLFSHNKSIMISDTNVLFGTAHCNLTTLCQQLYYYNLHSCAKQKKMRSTHACTPSFAPFLSIFTSVVVYSRTTKTICKLWILTCDVSSTIAYHSLHHRIR